jgi:hypothetical protein
MKPVAETGSPPQWPKSAGPRHRWVVGSLYRFPPHPTPKGSVVGSLREEVPVAASARETGDKWDQRKVPPLAEASCGAVVIKIAEVTAKAMLRPFSRHLPEVRGAIMAVRSRKYQIIITRRFCKSSGYSPRSAAPRPLWAAWPPVRRSGVYRKTGLDLGNVRVISGHQARSSRVRFSPPAENDQLVLAGRAK